MIGNSKSASEETLEIGKDSGQDESIVNGRNNKPAPTAPTLRARFVGQGYKQVKIIIRFFKSLKTGRWQMLLLKKRRRKKNRSYSEMDNISSSWVLIT